MAFYPVVAAIPRPMLLVSVVVILFSLQVVHMIERKKPRTEYGCEAFGGAFQKFGEPRPLGHMVAWRVGSSGERHL